MRTLLWTLIVCVFCAIPALSVTRRPAIVPRCRGGQRCPGPIDRCPSGMQPVRRCSPYGRCRPGYTCYSGWCCRDTCPAGSLTGPQCDRYRPCKYGYTCRRGNCCSNQCPSPKMIKGSFCNVNQPCQPNYKCFNGICCRWANINFGYCPRVRPPPYIPVCPPNLAEIFPTCTSDRDCARLEKCCSTDCGLMRCVTALQYPPDDN